MQIRHDVLKYRGNHVRGPTSQPDVWRTASTRASELQEIKLKPLRYVVPGLIPEGVSLLVSRPKLGKSWLMLDVCIAIATGQPTLGALTPPTGDVLYLALEDGMRRLQRRMAALMPQPNAPWPHRLALATEWRRTNEGGLDDIRGWCLATENPVAVVVDTLERFRARRAAKAAYQLCYDAVAELQRIAIEHQIAIIIVHHERKTSADDPFYSIAGTLALSGAADTLLLLKHEARGDVLYVRGRDVDDSETRMLFDRDRCRWLLCGPPEEAGRSKERDAVLALLTQASAPLDVERIAKALGLKRSVLHTLLSRMVADSAIVRTAPGRYAGPNWQAR
ncbi:MAG: AAA family ATPase [Hyphomicrobiales bacterium]|nr:AAA family ATPase [Hyphomicrobiales bacterium]